MQNGLKLDMWLALQYICNKPISWAYNPFCSLVWNLELRENYLSLLQDYDWISIARYGTVGSFVLSPGKWKVT